MQVCDVCCRVWLSSQSWTAVFITWTQGNLRCYVCRKTWWICRYVSQTVDWVTKQTFFISNVHTLWHLNDCSVVCVAAEWLAVFLMFVLCGSWMIDNICHYCGSWMIDNICCLFGSFVIDICCWCLYLVVAEWLISVATVYTLWQRNDWQYPLSLWQLKVLSYLPACSLVRMGQVCQLFASMYCDPWLWRRLYLREFGRPGGWLTSVWFQMNDCDCVHSATKRPGHAEPWR